MPGVYGSGWAGLGRFFFEGGFRGGGGGVGGGGGEEEMLDFLEEGGLGGGLWGRLERAGNKLVFIVVKRAAVVIEEVLGCGVSFPVENVFWRLG